jgi:hypothetical protein
VFVLAHLGLGTTLARPRLGARGLPWLLLGTLLPDLIDKPLYYGAALLTHRHGAELGLLSSTRIFGHSLALALVLYLLLPRRIGVPLVAGILTHLGLDELGDVFGRFWPSLRLVHDGPDTAHAILFPLLGFRFPVSSYMSPREHLASLANVYLLASEALGAALLAVQWRFLREGLGRRAREAERKRPGTPPTRA